jgi:hypothetical protein
VTAAWVRFVVAAGAAVVSVAALGCGEFARQGGGSYGLLVESLSATSGASGEESSFLQSDVRTNVGDPPVSTIFNDTGTATLALIAKNPEGPAPTEINAVTVSRYRVTFRRSDGRNTPGVDVPHPVEGAMTVTVPAGGRATAGFDLIRHTAKQEAPLAALRGSGVFISTVADITFFGRDRSGRDVSASGSLGVTFGDFGDPD